MVLGWPMGVLARQVVALEDLGGPFARLPERLAAAGGWQERFAALDAFLGARLADARRPAPGVAWAWTSLRATHGATPVGALAAELGWSRRRLAGSFREQVGLPPKLYARILRFRHVLRRLDGRPEPHWAEIAYDCGYYDQAHFNRDFRAFAGTTPTDYLGRRLPGGGGVSGV
jgi:AraC-like DNA-binding protein